MQADVLIAGDGPAAQALAISLGRHRPGTRVLLCGMGAAREDAGETLPPGIRPYLHALGLWPAFQAQGHQPAYQGLSCWNHGQPRDNPFMFTTEGHGWQIRRRNFQALLCRRAWASGAVPIRGWVKQIRTLDGGWQVQVGDKNIQAGCLVDATGRNAAVARRLGANVRRDDRLIARLHRFEGVDALPSLVEPTENGWFYSSALPNGETSCAFMTDQGAYPDWRAALGQAPHTRARLHGLNQIGETRRRPAHSQCLDRFAGHRWAAIGDAAQCYDPLSSDGIRKALHDGIGVSLLVEAWLDGDADGAAEMEARYNRAQQQTYAQYLNTWRDFYRQERRWPEAGFWRSRRHHPGYQPSGHQTLENTP